MWRRPCGLTDNAADVGVVKAPAAVADEEARLVAGREQGPRVLEVGLDDLPQGYDPILASLSVNPKLAASKVQVVKRNPGELAYPDARGIEDLEHGAVAKAEGRFGVGLREKPADLLAAQDVARNLVIEPGKLQLRGGVLEHGILGEQVPEEPAHAGQPLPLCRMGNGFVLGSLDVGT